MNLSIICRQRIWCKRRAWCNRANRERRSSDSNRMVIREETLTLQKSVRLLDSIRKSPPAPMSPAPTLPPRLPPPAGHRLSAPLHRWPHHRHPPPRLAPAATPAPTLLLIQTCSREVHTLSYSAIDLLRQGREGGLAPPRRARRTDVSDLVVFSGTTEQASDLVDSAMKVHPWHRKARRRR
jgi:hypothetical protein